MPREESSPASSSDKFTYVAPPAKITGNAYTPMNPARLVDTRCSASPAPSYCSLENLPSTNSTLGAISMGNPITVQVAGIDDIPTSATAFVGNLAATGGTGGGYLTVYSGSTAPTTTASTATAPTTSDVNFTTGAAVANMVIGQLSSNGQVNIASSATVNAVLDVSGWFTSATS